jgi:pyruvate/2-oxoglutarate dehydrogenase complex dihydrolipoamide acyltransferase (E2) component
MGDDYVFRLPDVGEGTAEAEIVGWHVAVGDQVEEDQPLVDVSTDKAVVEMTSPVSGVVVSTHYEVGDRQHAVDARPGRGCGSRIGALAGRIDSLGTVRCRR